jgi:hypothetical protein
MIKPLLLSTALLMIASGCQRPQEAPPAIASAPPTLTSAPVPLSQPPPGHPPPPPRDEIQRIYRLDFVLTPKDPKDASLGPTSFTLNLVENQGGEVMIGRNVPLQGPTTVPPTPGSKDPPAQHIAPRQDVGVKVSAHMRSLPGSDDVLLDVQLELSAVEGTTNGVATIRKITSRGSVVASMGKSALVTSVDDDKRHYELTITPTKIR